MILYESSFVQSTTVDSTFIPYPPSITISTKSLYFSKISSGSVGYSVIKSSSIIEVDIIGFLNFFEISLIILLSGIRIPTVFLLLNIFGILFVPFKIIVKGPGKILFNNLKVRLLICLAYLERLL